MASADPNTQLQEMRKAIEDINRSLQNRGADSFVQHCRIRTLEQRLEEMTLKPKRQRVKCKFCGKWGNGKKEAGTSADTDLQ